VQGGQQSLRLFANSFDPLVHSNHMLPRVRARDEYLNGKRWPTFVPHLFVSVSLLLFTTYRGLLLFIAIRSLFSVHLNTYYTLLK